MNPKITDKHIEICENYARRNINMTQAKFLLVSEGLSDQESETLIDQYMSTVLNIYDILFFASLACLCFIATSALTLFVVWMNT